MARWETDDLTSRDGWDLHNEESDRQIVNQLPIVIACDDDDPPDMDIYTPSVVKYPGADDVYLATMSMYHHFTPDEMDDDLPPRNDGLMDIQLAVSRDGISWDRPDRRPYVGIDAEGPGQRMLYAAQVFSSGATRSCNTTRPMTSRTVTSARTTPAGSFAGPSSVWTAS